MIEHYQNVARSTAIYPKSRKFLYPALGMVGEFGECADALLPSKSVEAIKNGKKIVINQDNAAKELGDVLWYITNTTLDIDLTLQDLASDITGGLESTSFNALAFSMTEDQDNRRIFLLFMIRAGVVCEAAKKAIRDNRGRLQREKLPAVRKALAGCLRAWLQICQQYEVHPDDAAILNIEKLTRRRDEGKLHGDGDNR